MLFRKLPLKWRLRCLLMSCGPLGRNIVAERERLFAGLHNIKGFTPVRSLANFFVVHSVIEPKRVVAQLLSRDILIRDVSGYPMLSDYFRVSVGSPEENNLLLRALADLSQNFVSQAGIS
jgi:histidinol-phosphate/aromatic aminotransferase/cobyric acid decarboxylase-like protein